MRLFNLLFIIISSLVFLAHYFLIGQAVYGDGRFYFSYARSLTLQGNLDIKDELTHTFSPQDNNINTNNAQVFTTYPVQSLGPALFWSPIIYIGNKISLKLSLLSNGFSDIYQISVGLFSIALTSLAFNRLGNFLLKKFSSTSTFLTLILLWAGSNLFFYTAIDNVNTHFFSFSLAAFALCEYLDNKKPSIVFTGLLAGLAFQNRQLDLLFHLSLFISFFLTNKKIANLIRYILFFFLAILPQLYVWFIQFGSFLPPMSGNGFWNFSPAALLDIFFQLPNGLFFTAPIIFTSGIFFLIRSQNHYFRSAKYSLLAFLLITSFWWSPLGGASYGPRFLIIFYPLLSISLAQILNKVANSRQYLIATVFVLLNLTHTFIFLLAAP